MADSITVGVPCNLAGRTDMSAVRLLGRTYRCYFAVNNRIIRAARVTRGEIRSAVDAADWTEFVPIAVASGLAGRLEAGYSVEIQSFQSQPALQT